MGGFIDLHTHGSGRFDTRTDNPDDILRIAESHAASGTAAILPTLYSGSPDVMRANMGAVRSAMEAQRKMNVSSELPGGSGKTGILGVHLEGPFLNPERCGAQGRDTFLKPSIRNLEKLLDGYEDIVRIITVAPELPDAMHVIRRCADIGIKVNMGHSDATFSQAREAKNAGATGITHIFNAMRPLHHRDPGLIGFGLLDEDIYIEVIADGIHLATETLQLIFRTKRLDRIILISDRVKDPGGEGVPAYTEPGVLAGSAITLSEAVHNTVDAGITEAVATEAAVDNPKRYLER